MEEGVPDGDGGGVAGWEEDLQDLVAERDGVADPLGHFVQQGVPVGRGLWVWVWWFRSGWGNGRRCFCEGALDVLVDEGVDFVVRLFPRCIEPVEELQRAGPSATPYPCH